MRGIRFGAGGFRTGGSAPGSLVWEVFREWNLVWCRGVWFGRFCAGRFFGGGSVSGVWFWRFCEWSLVPEVL